MTTPKNNLVYLADRGGWAEENACFPDLIEYLRL